MRRKHIVSILFLSFAVSLLGGCSFATTTGQAENALEEKYGEQFKIINISKESVLAEYYTVIAYAEEYPDLPFEATIEYDSGDISDSYVSKRVCNRMAQTIIDNISGIAEEYFIFVETTPADTSLTDPEISLKKYLEKYPSSTFTICLCIEKSDSLDVSNIVSSVSHLLDGFPEINGSFALYIADTETMTYIEEYVSSNVTTYTDFDRKTEESYVGSIEINNSQSTHRLKPAGLKKSADS